MVVFKRIMIGIITVIILFSVVLYDLQDEKIFIQKKTTQEHINNILKLADNIEEINIETKDGTKLHGLFVNNIKNKDSKVVFYYGGNAGEASSFVENFLKYNDWSVVLVNYRGYGLSEGDPSESKLFGDALEIYDYFMNKTSFSKVVAIGRSLGTGVATYLAENRKLNGVILISPYDSLLSIAKFRYPFLPTSLILKHKFDSISRAQKIKVPLYMLIVSDDKVIPIKFSKNLAKIWGGVVAIKEIKNQSHDSVVETVEYWQFIEEVLKDV